MNAHSSSKWYLLEAMNMQHIALSFFFIPRFFHPTDGPVTVGMSLDIASIDTISEINMVRRKKLWIFVQVLAKYNLF